MEEVSGGREGFEDVGEHVGHCLIDAGPVRAAVDPLTILGEGGEVDGFGCAIPAEVCQFRSVMEPVVERNVLGREVGTSCTGLAWDGQCLCGNVIQVEAVKVSWGGGDRCRCGDTASGKIGDLEEA
jgi:hypothetical protein